MPCMQSAHLHLSTNSADSFVTEGLKPSFQNLESYACALVKGCTSLKVASALHHGDHIGVPAVMGPFTDYADQCVTCSNCKSCSADSS